MHQTQRRPERPLPNPQYPLTCAGDLRERLRVPLRSQGYCGFGRGLLGLLWVWCNGRGPHLELRQEPQGSASNFLALDLTWIAGSLLSGSGDSDLVFCGGMELRLPLKLFKDDTTFRAVCGTCMFFGDARGHQCSFVFCLHPQVCLEEVSGHRVLLKCGPGNQGLSACCITHEATSLISS